MRQAVILAGGKGTRLRDRLGGRPKPLVDIDGMPLLERQIAALQANAITHILLLVNHAADQIRGFCDGAAFADVTIELVDDGDPRGTAGALLAAFGRLAERFLVVYGDTLFDVDIAQFWDVHEQADADASLLLHPNDHPFDSDLVEVDAADRVVALHATPHDPQAWLPNLVNAAMYVLERDAIAFWRDAPPPSDIARDLFPAMLRRGARLHGHLSGEYIKDIGTPARLDRAVAALRSGAVARARRGVAQRAVVLDRDGTINELRGHIARAEEFALLPGAADAVRRLNEAEYRVVVATNQPVLARGETTPAELARIHAKMDTLLGRAGAWIDRLYYCPHHPDRGFPGEVAELKGVCDCRKPAPGMIHRAAADLGIDLAESWLVGDSSADIALARSQGMRSVLVRTGLAGQDGKHPVAADFTVADLPEAVALILDRWPRLAMVAAPFAGRCDAGDVVLVGGLARAGKSGFAAALALQLRAAGRGATVVALDHWLRSASARDPGVLGRYDMAAAVAAVAALAAGEAVTGPTYDPMTRTSHPGRVRLSAAPGDVVVVEGCPALLCEPLRAMAAHTVYVEVSEDERRRRFEAEYRRRGLAQAHIEALYAARELDEHAPIRAGVAAADRRVRLEGCAAA